MRLLITGAWQATQTEIDGIRSLGHEIIWLKNERNPLPCAYEDIDGVICNGLFLYHPIELFASLRYVQLTSAGLDRVPLDYIRSHPITLHNAGGVYSIPMAEFALCGVLQLYKKSRIFSQNQSAHCWEKQRDLMELYGKTVGILGCGSVGTECAKRFAAFGCHVIGINRTGKHSQCFDSVVSIEQLDVVLPKVDVLILALPLTQQTTHLIEKSCFEKMKTGAILVNVSRGAVVDTNSLIQALENKLGGAVLDVFESEPLDKENPLWDMENVILTPHNSFVGDGNRRRLYSVIKKNLEQVK